MDTSYPSSRVRVWHLDKNITLIIHTHTHTHSYHYPWPLQKKNEERTITKPTTTTTMKCCVRGFSAAPIKHSKSIKEENGKEKCTFKMCRKTYIMLSLCHYNKHHHYNKSNNIIFIQITWADSNDLLLCAFLTAITIVEWAGRKKEQKKTIKIYAEYHYLLFLTLQSALYVHRVANIPKATYTAPSSRNLLLSYTSVTGDFNCRVKFFFFTFFS